MVQADFPPDPNPSRTARTPAMSFALRRVISPIPTARAACISKKGSSANRFRGTGWRKESRPPYPPSTELTAWGNRA